MYSLASDKLGVMRWRMGLKALASWVVEMDVVHKDDDSEAAGSAFEAVGRLGQLR